MSNLHFTKCWISHTYCIYTWLNAVEFFTLVLKIMWQLFKFGHYSLLTNNVYPPYSTIDCGLNYSHATTIGGAEFDQVNKVTCCMVASIDKYTMKSY